MVLFQWLFVIEECVMQYNKIKQPKPGTALLLLQLLTVPGFTKEETERKDNQNCGFKNRIVFQIHIVFKK